MHGGNSGVKGRDHIPWLGQKVMRTSSHSIAHRKYNTAQSQAQQYRPSAASSVLQAHETLPQFMLTANF